MTTVAADTHNRTTTGTVTLGDGETCTGASLAAHLGRPGPARLRRQSSTAGSFDTGVEIDTATVAYFDPWTQQ
ncbi:hypothetical protein [Streptomyces carpinensis]|uniref:Uncharacterized protein n=1 Tax=Streptomyces carpinensis TaxID=66369 RepID=A0ABV1W1Q0_9ACTN|nr:hypothetical protein [Streptomyces carpinensis]